jgi:hypothetical protein
MRSARVRPEESVGFVSVGGITFVFGGPSKWSAILELKNPGNQGLRYFLRNAAQPSSITGVRLPSSFQQHLEIDP